GRGRGARRRVRRVLRRDPGKERRGRCPAGSSTCCGSGSTRSPVAATTRTTPTRLRTDPSRKLAADRLPEIGAVLPPVYGAVDGRVSGRAVVVRAVRPGRFSGRSRVAVPGLPLLVVMRPTDGDERVRGGVRIGHQD